MTKPLALIFHETLLTGNQLLNRLTDLDYRTRVVSDPARLPDQAAAEAPIVVIVEIGALAERVCAAIRSLKAAEGTAHIPAVAFVKAAPRKEAARAMEQARAAGARLVVAENALLPHLPQLLEQALSVD